MNAIKTFYKKTIFFWVITEMIFIIPCIIAIVDLSFQKNIPTIVVNSFFALYTLSIIASVILRLTKRKNPIIIRVFVGVFSIIISLGLLYLLVFESKQVYVIFAFCVVIWMLFYGFWKFIGEATATNRRFKRLRGFR